MILSNLLALKYIQYQTFDLLKDFEMINKANLGLTLRQITCSVVLYSYFLICIIDFLSLIENCLS